MPQFIEEEYDYNTWGEVGKRWTPPKPNEHGDEIRWGDSQVRSVDVTGLGTFQPPDAPFQVLNVIRPGAKAWDIDVGLTIISPRIQDLPAGLAISGVFRIETGTGSAKFVRYVPIPFAAFPNPGLLGEPSNAIVSIPNVPARSIVVSCLWQVNTLAAAGRITVQAQACAAPIIR